MLSDIIFGEVKIRNPNKLLIGVSGGVDSMVLLHTLYKLDMNIVVAHVNYSLRGEDSVKDEALVHNFCRLHNIPFYCKRVLRNKPSSNIQDWARNLRYQYFSQLEYELNTDITVLGHNRDDFLETILMNIIQGKSFQTFKGIPKRNGTILRPMLSISKGEIFEYAKIHEIPFRHDKSNFENDYFRNRVRNEILPRLLQINCKFDESLEQMSYFVKFLENELSVLVDGCLREKESMLILDRFVGFSKVLQMAIMQQVLNRNGEFDITRAEIGNTLRLVKSQVGKKSDIGEICIIREREGLKFVRISHNSNEERNNECVLDLSELITKITVNNLVISKEAIYREMSFSQSELKFFTEEKKVNIRRWKFGDKMRPLGSSGSRKVKKILTDAKVSSSQRSETLVMTDTAENILAILFPESHSKIGIIADKVKLRGNEEFVYRITKASFE